MSRSKLSSSSNTNTHKHYEHVFREHRSTSTTKNKCRTPRNTFGLEHNRNSVFHKHKFTNTARPHSVITKKVAEYVSIWSLSGVRQRRLAAVGCACAGRCNAGGCLTPSGCFDLGGCIGTSARQPRRLPEGNGCATSPSEALAQASAIRRAKASKSSS